MKVMKCTSIGGRLLVKATFSDNKMQPALYKLRLRSQTCFLWPAGICIRGAFCRMNDACQSLKGPAFGNEYGQEKDVTLGDPLAMQNFLQTPSLLIR